MILLAVDNAEAIGWSCFVLGALLVLAGGVVGIIASLKGEAQAKLKEAKSKIDDTKDKIDEATAPGLDSGAGAGAAQEASASAEAAKSALEQVQGIVGSLPENLRFAGVLVLIGAVLMSVATIQFGGVSLF